VQEAAATRLPVIGSEKIPFVKEYLMGETPTIIEHDVQVGEGGLLVEADDVEGFACALRYLLSDKDGCESMGARAYEITIPAFTWDSMAGVFLEKLRY
jgi:glycosyltransferase involved in cell wall biosynthesis